MHWTQRAEQTLTDFLAQVPDDWRERVRATARKAAAIRAHQVGNDHIDVDELVIGYIQATPARLRRELRPILQAAGIDVSHYSRHF